MAQQLHDKLKAEGLSPKLAGVGDYKSKTLPDEDIVVLVTSTQGEGEPPEEAVPLHKFLFGKKSPKLDGLHFAVLGLGDSSYPKFCQAGRDFDAQLEKLGAQRLHERTDCDLDFQATATAWIDSVTQKLQKLAASAAASPAAEGAGNACAAPASSAAQNPGTTAPAGAGAGAAAASATAASQTSAGTQAGTAPQAGSTTQTGAAGSVPQTGAGNQPAPGAPAYAGQQPAQPSPAQTGISHAAPAAAPATPRFSPLPAGYPFPGFPFTIVGSPAPMPSGFSAGATAGAAGLLHALGQGIPGLGLLPGAGGVPLQNPFLDPAVASSTLQQAAALQAASLQALALQAGIAFPGQVPGGLMPQGMPGAQGMPGIPAAPGGMPGALPGLDGGGLGYGLYAAPDLQGDVAVQADPQVAQHAATALAEAQVAPGTEAQPETSTWTRATPFTATLSARQKITARKAEKDVQHIEIDLEGSGIQYQPGDALGVWPVNAPALVSEILSLHQLKGDETVKLADGTESTLRDALTHHADITQNTPTLVEQYAALSKLRPLQELVENREALDALLATTPPVGLFAEYPHPLPAQQLYSLFRPQAPRLYSIASAQDDVGEAVHLTVGVVHFQHHGQHYMGAASGYLGHLLEEDDEVRVFVEPNRHFRLPEDDDTPIIMIGAGTGVAPFRAFMQQREANGAGGKNWLIFGNQRFTDDFLYQAEWLQHRKSGLLTRADLAWSRQGEQKVYVQHKLLEAGADVWQWLQEGAHVYVCGDASRMARDVENALLDIIRTHGGLDEDDADDYLNTLREDRRYQRDVY